MRGAGGEPVDLALQTAGGRVGAGAVGAHVAGEDFQAVEEGGVRRCGVGHGVGELVEPVPGPAGFAQAQVVQVQAVGSGAAASAGGELPPELGGFGVPGQGKQAGVDEGAVDVELCDSSG